ncbi:tryptophan-rich sensory protein [uncultured Jannaschia sp.]|uniref:TspO/MBR family protein n=1 Tax=uncultured Jannaschia sp. TaxID=293347 RepID=UPI00260FA06C|nr:tryptophan-rich sensory protein [uncultured Jannaschia sp.]
MRLKAILVLLAALAFAGSPLLNPGFGGYDPSQFPTEMMDPPVLPAGYAFSIWGVIYLWLIVMAGYGLWRRIEDTGWDATRWPLIVSLGIGAVWLPVAAVSPLWATILIWAMLLSALVALLRAPRRDRWLLGAPIGLYAGWLSAAACVSLGVLLTGYGVPPFDATGWAIVLLSLALCIGVAILRARPWATFGLAIVWALIAVLVRNGFDLVGLFAVSAAVVIGALTVLPSRGKLI